MKVTIEVYRKFNIQFDTEIEKFIAVHNLENSEKELSSKYFGALKKNIDEFIKSNFKFKPFEICSHPKEHFSKRFDGWTVVGIRKDKRLILESPEGEKSQISDYQLSDYVVFTEDNIKHLEQLKSLKEQRKIAEKDFKMLEDEIVEEMKLIDLKTYRDENLIID